MTESPHDRGTAASPVALDVHGVVNSLAAIQCQWFLVKASLTPDRLASIETTAMDRLLSELSTRVEQLQTKVLVANKVRGAGK
jgi:hypothetical protein